MKTLLFVLVFFAITAKHHAQFFPTLEDQEFIEIVFISQCGWVGNDSILSVYLFQGKERHGDKIYLVHKNGRVSNVNVPDFLIEQELVLIKSGPKYFAIQTRTCSEEDSVGEIFYYFFSGNRSGVLSEFAEKKIRGHDNEDTIKD